MLRAKLSNSTPQNNLHIFKTSRQEIPEREEHINLRVERGDSKGCVTGRVLGDQELFGKRGLLE